MLQCHLYGGFLQTPGVQLMKITCKSINWHKNTLQVDANIQESLYRENLDLA